MKYQVHLRYCRFVVKVGVSFLLSAVLPSLVFGGVTLSKMDEHVAFRIDDRVFTYRGYKQFYRLASQQASRSEAQQEKELLKGLIENYLLALSADDHELKAIGESGAQGEHGSKHGHEHKHENERTHKETHDHGLDLYADTYSEYRELLSLMVTAPPQFTADQVLVPVGKASNLEESLASLLDSEMLAQQGTKRRRIVSKESFSASQQDAAEKLIVGRYQLPGDAVVSVSYWDVYRIQSVQNRAKVRRGDLQSIQQGVKNWVELKLLERSVKQEKHLTDPDLRTLWQFVWDKQYKQQYYLETGIVMDLHHDQPLLERFKRQVTEDEIKQYYQNHKAEFVQVGSVVARHITLDTQIKADYVYGKLQSGMDFDEAVERYSLSKDGGQLGFINKRDKNLSFVKKLALIQAVGRVSTPYRMLDGKSYEIILVDKKQPEPLPLTDKSVRNQIANTLAVGKAKSDLKASFSIWIKEHNIVLNSRYFKDIDGLF